MGDSRMDFWTILNSSGLSTLVVLVTGLFAFGIYFLQKRNEKKDAATIIVTEIRMAEQAILGILNIKRIGELSIILPNNTWETRKHLFVGTLDQDEYNLVNDFYTKCEMAENYRLFYFRTLNESVKSKSNHLQVSLIELMIESIKNGNGSVEYQERKGKLIAMANAEDWLFDPNRPTTTLIEYITNIRNITTTSAGGKLKKIGRLR